MRFYHFVERWCMSYKPMLHEPGETSKNNRFLYVDSYLAMTDVCKNIPTLKSPCLVMESAQEGTMDERFDYPEYTLYFMVKGDVKPDGRKNFMAKWEAKQHWLKFRTYFSNKKEDMKEFEHLSLENLQYSTIGPLFNGWYAVAVTIPNIEKLNQCIDPNDYEEIDYGEGT
mgnify:CR=1 FL=1